VFAFYFTVTPLTPWELWLVRKGEEERRRVEEARERKVGIFFTVVRLYFWCKQLLETKERKEAARAKLQLQVKAQEAFQEWKQRKDEAIRRRKQAEREEMKQRRIASTEVCH